MGFRCSLCTHDSPRWYARCPHCGEPDALDFIAPAAQPAVVDASRPEDFDALGDVEAAATRFVPSGFANLDAILGGGFAVGGCYLLAGSPGAGKSTLALQIAATVSHARRVIYLSGEEPKDRLKLRARRLGHERAPLIVTELTDLAGFARAVRALHPLLIVVDSLNTLSVPGVRSRPGSPTQLVACAIRLTELAQSYECAILGIGHVTKTNSLSGPRSVEHHIDAMLHFHARGESANRVLVASKNRFGPSHIPARFTMTETGLYPKV